MMCSSQHIDPLAFTSPFSSTATQDRESQVSILTGLQELCKPRVMLSIANKSPRRGKKLKIGNLRTSTLPTIASLFLVGFCFVCFGLLVLVCLVSPLLRKDRIDHGVLASENAY